jgi:carbonic anhydrase
VFELKQFHMHAPSEHHLEGKSFLMEAHLVHANSRGQLAVIGFLYTAGPTENTNSGAAYARKIYQADWRGRSRAATDKLKTDSSLILMSLESDRFRAAGLPG